MSDAREDETDFFVGYAETPKIDRRFLMIAAPALLIGSTGLGAVVGLNQRHAGHGAWEYNTIERRTGILVIDPYPALLEPDERGGYRRLLLVSEGKSGPLGDYADCDGRELSIAGSLVRRGANAMLALPESYCQTPRIGPKRAVPPPQTRAEPISARGEIIDTKCYFGAMRPGDGKAHKACATLCIKGGVPPAIVYRDARDMPQVAIITDESGRRADSRIWPYVADPVRLTGRRSLKNGLPYLAADLDRIIRV